MVIINKKQTKRMVHSDENKSIVCEYMNKEHNNDYNGSKRQIEVDEFICAVKSIDFLKVELAKASIDFYKKPKTSRWGRKWE